MCGSRCLTLFLPGQLRSCVSIHEHSLLMNIYIFKGISDHQKHARTAKNPVFSHHVTDCG